MVPFFLARLDDMMPQKVTGLSRTINDTYKANVWVTPSGLFERPQFDFVHNVLGADRIIRASDYPYLTLDGTRESQIAHGVRGHIDVEVFGAR
jgi:uncharacterized protein